MSYEFVFPELESRNLWGLFFIPTFPYLKNKILDVHRIHLLCGAFTGKELLNELLQLINEEMILSQRSKSLKIKHINVKVMMKALLNLSNY